MAKRCDPTWSESVAAAAGRRTPDLRRVRLDEHPERGIVTR